MAIPILAGAIAGAGKLLGNIFGPEGKARRQARRAARKSSGKASTGLFGGALKNLFNRKNNKAARIEDSANKVLAKKLAQKAKLEVPTKEYYEEQVKKAGGAITSFKDRIAGVTRTVLPAKIKIPSLSTLGIRLPQQFQLPPDVRESIIRSDDTGAKPTYARDDFDKPFKKPIDPMILYVGGGAAALLLIILLTKK